jgi:hypothetical protein
MELRRNMYATIQASMMDCVGIFKSKGSTPTLSRFICAQQSKLHSTITTKLSPLPTPHDPTAYNSFRLPEVSHHANFQSLQFHQLTPYTIAYLIYVVISETPPTTAPQSSYHDGTCKTNNAASPPTSLPSPSPSPPPHPHPSKASAPESAAHDHQALQSRRSPCPDAVSTHH